MAFQYDIPRNYEQEEAKNLKPSRIKYMAGYEHFIFVDVPAGVITTANNVSLRLYDLGGNEIENLGVLTKYVFTPGSSRVRGSFTITNAANRPGEKIFVLFDDTTSEALLQSEIIEVFAPAEYSQHCLVEYRHSTYRDEINYEVFSEYQSLFLDLNQVDFGYEYDKVGYTEQSTGEYRPQLNQRRKFVTLEAYLFDESMCDFLMSLSDHDDIKINGEAVEVKQGFDPENLGVNNPLKKGTIQFYVKSFATTNLNN